MQEQELFQGYEVKNWDFSPRLYKILIFSAIFNVLALLVVAQSNLLTTKGCDSPLVGGVCQVLDTLYVGGSALTADKEYVNKEYDPTVLPSADEIVWIPVGDEPFKYPDGYRQLANPELFAQQTPTEIQNEGGFPGYIPGGTNPIPGGGTELINTAPVLPKDNKNPVTDLPSSPYSIGDNPTIPKPGKTRVRTPRQQKTQPNPTLQNDSPTDLPDLNGGKTATTDGKTKTPPNDKVSEIVINKKPMQDFAAVVRTKYDKKEVDLTQNFKVVAEGFLTKDGKLDVTLDKNKQPRSRVTVKEGNPEMIAIAEQAIAAIGDSGWLGYLRNQGVERINFTVVQNNDNLQVVITSDQPTPERAKTMASGLNGVIQGALLLDKNGVKKLGDDERILLSNAKVTDSGKQFILDFVLAKPVAQEMITRKLKEPVDVNSTQEKTNGNSAQVPNTTQTKAK